MSLKANPCMLIVTQAKKFFEKKTQKRQKKNEEKGENN